MIKNIKTHAVSFASLMILLSCFGTLNRAMATELIMFDEKYCHYCEQWLAEIGPIYPLTKEGRVAPLRRVDIHQARPKDLSHISGIRYSPTFVVIDDEKNEIGRITGYPGQDFFWGLLQEILEKPLQKTVFLD